MRRVLSAPHLCYAGQLRVRRRMSGEKRQRNWLKGAAASLLLHALAALLVARAVRSGPSAVRPPRAAPTIEVTLREAPVAVAPIPATEANPPKPAPARRARRIAPAGPRPAPAVIEPKAAGAPA